MKSPKIRLSFCIPTINRGSLIGRTLESIISQATDEVEIVIVDGGKSDNTKEVVSKFTRDFPSLRYVCSKTENTGATAVAPSGGGFDRDCCLAVALAQGEYCWLFTDDDVLKPGAIKRVLDATEHQYELIVANAEVWSSDLSEMLEASRVKLSDDRSYTSAEWQELFTDTAEYLSFVGGVIIKRQVWNARQHETYVGMGFMHFGVVFQSPFQTDALVIAEPLIQISYGDALYMRTSRFFEIWMFIWPSLIWSLPGISESSKSKICLREPWRSKRALIYLRAIGAYSTNEYHAWLKERFVSRWDRILAKVIAGSPGSILNFLVILRSSLSGSIPGLSRMDLMKSPFYFARAFRGLTSSSAAQSVARTVSPSGGTSR